eukprot:6328237-Amphidinium_carterae.1
MDLPTPLTTWRMLNLVLGANSGGPGFLVSKGDLLPVVVVGPTNFAKYHQRLPHRPGGLFEVCGGYSSWPPDLKEMLYLQLPKEGTKNAGERRPIVLLPQVYRLRSACCRADVLSWRQLCKDRCETPVGQGALDKTSDLAYLTEERSAAGKHQAGVVLHCSKCYKRVPL